MKNKILIYVVMAVVGLSLAAGKSWAGTFLLTEYDYNEAGYGEIEAALESDGHTVDRVNGKVFGNIAAALGAKSYDSVFLYDLTFALYLGGADLTALTDFYSTHSSLVVDTRSYGFYFQGTDPSEIALIQNVATEFVQRGGGVWVGTDHDPDWTNNGNAFLAAIGVNKITGSFSDAVNSNDPASELLFGVTTTDLWAAGASVGRAPLGIQPNGTDMRFHFGHSSPQSGAIAYITASFGSFVAPDEDPDTHNGGGTPGVIPEPSSMLLLGSGLIGAFARRKKS